jgi:hypothetical protein
VVDKNPILKSLKEGVSFHAYSDLSGCSFYNHNTGETISIEVCADELLNYYLSLNTQNLANTEIYTFINGLIQSNYITCQTEYKT